MSKLKNLFSKSRLRALKGAKRIRSDICYHVLMEPHLRQAFAHLDVSPKESDIALAQAQQNEKNKKGLFNWKKNQDKAAEFILRRLVRAHLNYLLIKSELHEMRETLNEKIMTQQDVLSTSHNFPEALNAKALTPDRAISNLEHLKKQIEDQLRAIEDDLKLRNERLKQWLEQLDETMQAFFNNCQTANKATLTETLTDAQKKEITRMLSGITPASLVNEAPEKGAQHYDLYQTAKKLLNKRGSV